MIGNDKHASHIIHFKTVNFNILFYLKCAATATI